MIWEIRKKWRQFRIHDGSLLNHPVMRPNQSPRLSCPELIRIKISPKPKSRLSSWPLRWSWATFCARLLSSAFNFMPSLVAHHRECVSRLLITLRQKSRFTLWKSQFSQKSQFQILIFHKVHNFKVSFFTKFSFLKVLFFTKFTFWKSHFSQNYNLLAIRSWRLRRRTYLRGLPAACALRAQ